MATGIQHQKFHRKYRILSIGAAVISLYYYENILLSLAIPFGYWLGLFIDPDLDMTQTTIAEKRWKRTYYFFWMVPWVNLYGWFAQRVLGGHRSVLTHIPFLSTGIRMVWFSFPPFLLIIFMIYSGGINIPWDSLINCWIGILLGQTLSDTIHVIADL